MFTNNSTEQSSSSECNTCSGSKTLRDNGRFTLFAIALIVCNMLFIVHVAFCAVFCLSVACYFVRYVYFCVLCLILVRLPPGKTHLQFN
jgi:hypothetical protein